MPINKANKKETIWLDVKIVFLTFRTVILGKGQ